MADFCKPCTSYYFGAFEDGSELPNDFRWVEHPLWGLCEGCGVHVFVKGGDRAHDLNMKHMEEYAPPLKANCPECLAYVRQAMRTSDRGLVRAFLRGEE